MDFGDLLKQFLIDLQRLFRSRVTDRTVTLPQILLISSIPDNGIDMTSLSQRLGVDNSTLTRLVDVLLKRDWVYKTKNVKDRRISLLFLTTKGEEIQEEVEEKIDDLGLQVYRAIPPDDGDEVKEILSSFHWALSKMLLKSE
ncbi:MAG: MarR family winged helix-turn-helix transcriptional regulator [Fidelibacterota bacterium]